MLFNLLLVDSDAAYVSALAQTLRSIKHQVTIVNDGRAAIASINGGAFDAIILDRVLPRLDGMSVVAILRSGGMTIPIIMVTTLLELQDKIEGLDAGVDDYIAKPAAATELIARLRAILRGRRWSNEGSDTLRVGEIVVSPTTFRAWYRGVPIDLAKLEFSLLVELARNEDAVLSRSFLFERVWGHSDMPDTNLIDVYIRRLRIKLRKIGDANLIKTVKGVGYTMSVKR